jgi:hypothetical protein
MMMTERSSKIWEGKLLRSTGILDTEDFIKKGKNLKSFLLHFVRKAPATFSREIYKGQIYLSSKIWVGTNHYHCNAHKRRSAGDIFLVAKKFYPKVTLKEIRETLRELALEGQISTNYCHTIQKRVFFNKDIFGHRFCILGVKDEFGKML